MTTNDNQTCDAEIHPLTRTSPAEKPAGYGRTHPAVPTLRANTAMTRAYFRCLRAAEMAAWEMTGGDYVISGKFGEAS